MARTRAWRFAAAAAGVLLVALCTSCMELDQSLTVHEDGSGEMVTEILLDEDAAGLMAAFGGSAGLDDLVEEMSRDLPADVGDRLEVESFERDGRPGISMRVSFESIEDLQEAMAAAAGTEAAAQAGVGLAEGGTGEVVLRPEGEGWFFEMTGVQNAVPSDEGITDDPALEALGPEAGEALEEMYAEMAQALEGFEMRFSVTLPGSIVDSNADEVDGNTARWTFTFEDEGPDRLFAQSGPPPPFPILPAAVGGVLLLAVVGGALLLLRGRRARQLEPIVVGAPGVSGEPSYTPGGPAWGPAPSAPPTGPPTAPYPSVPPAFAPTPTVPPPGADPAPPAFAPPTAPPATSTPPTAPPPYTPPASPPAFAPPPVPPTEEQPPAPPPWAPPEPPG